ncbi:MAG: glycogen/starch synthase [Syntrophales bacterium]|nr:glycogen/starch synthase [Syntrophales bacterium]
MAFFVLYILFHEPLRLHPDRDRFLWDEFNRERFLNRGDNVYLPFIELLSREIDRHPSFKVVIGVTGTFLEQAELWMPQIIDSLRELQRSSSAERSLEFVNQTYYHSFVGLFSDPEKQEFRDQVALHREKMRNLFDVLPVTFASTKRILTQDMVKTVGDMGFKVVLGGGDGQRGTLYRSRDRKLLIMTGRGSIDGLTDAEAVFFQSDDDFLLFHLDLLRFSRWDGNLIKSLISNLYRDERLSMVLPMEVASDLSFSSCPEWDDTSFCLEQVYSDPAQLSLFGEIEALETEAKKAGRELLSKWRYVTITDHLDYITHLDRDDHPYGRSGSQATYVLTRQVESLRTALFRFEVLKKAERTAVLMISPETGRLPEGMGRLARYISGKSGGQGEVVAALCEGLLARGVDVHLTTLNLKRRFQKESQIGEEEWKAIRYNVPPERIHLVSSAIFSHKLHAYDGDPVPTAAEFQRQVVNYVLKDIRARHEGRLIVHSHDWMAGGIITAYARATDLPVLHTVHNVFTAPIPLTMMEGVDLNNFYERLFLTIDNGRMCIDAQATAIKNATLINFVGERFLEEIVNDYFLDRPIIPSSVRQEVKAKYFDDAVRVIINAPSPSLYPENCDYLVRKYGPDDDILAAKRENLLAFQRRTGLLEDPNAILLFWPSRLDPIQKGVELLEAIAQPFCDAHPEVQIAIIGDEVGGGHFHQEILGRIAWASGGRIVYYPFSESLSMLGYGAANDVFGASLYEPCGQIDQIANLFGATATNRDTGGYHDKITELQLKIDGAPKDMGNGFLFRDYDVGGLWYGLEKAVEFHRRPPEVREPQLRRIMKEARMRYDPANMIAAYIRLYEWLNGNKPLI